MTKKVLVAVLLLAAFSLAACGSPAVNVSVNSNAALNTNTETPATPAVASTEFQNSSPKAVVADLYKQHDAQKGPFFQTKDRAAVDKYFTKPLADLLWKDATTAGDEVGAIDGDPLYDAQDMEIKNFAIGEAVIKGQTATVPVTFTNFGKKQTITFSLKQEAAAWKIDNISYTRGDSLMKWLKETYPGGAKADLPGGNFEGKYIVGPTSCTLKVAKMGFEVRWAKGSGVETFFPKEGNTFEASTSSGRPNQFVFDDGNYNSGTYYRADGKTFPIKRAK